jgi:hypothetical protein
MAGLQSSGIMDQGTSKRAGCLLLELICLFLLWVVVPVFAFVANVLRSQS